MKERTKNVIIGIIFFIISISGFAFFVDVLLIDNLNVDISFLGSVIGALIGAAAVSGTTYLIIGEQRKITISQINAQKETTIKQVEDSDKRDRERIYLKYILDEYDRLLKDFIEIEDRVSLFHDAVLKNFNFNKLTKTIPPQNPMYPKLIEMEINSLGDISVRKQSVENKTLGVLGSLSSFIERELDVSIFSRLNEILKVHMTFVEKVAKQEGMTIETLHKSIQQDMEKVTTVYIEITNAIFDNKTATMIKIIS